MPALEFVSESLRDVDAPTATSERLINLYPEPLPEGALARYALKTVLGLEDWSAGPPDVLFVRALTTVDNVLFAVIGSNLYRIAEDGTVTNLGAIVGAAPPPPLFSEEFTEEFH